MSSSSRPISGPGSPTGREPPRGPTQEEWDRLSPEERVRYKEALHQAGAEYDEWLSSVDPGALAQTEVHLDATVETRETLRHHFKDHHPGLYVATNLDVYYPGEPKFLPDVLAVWGVSIHKRDSYVVIEEGKGLDLVIEVLRRGDREKDLKTNVVRYARLGIKEYFVADLAKNRLWAYRLPEVVCAPAQRRYEQMLGDKGRYRSEVLGLSLVLSEKGLRLYHGTRELQTLSEELGLLEQEVKAERQAKEQERQAKEQALQAKEQERQAKELALAELRRSILAILLLRGLDPPNTLRERLEGCDDVALLSRFSRRAVTEPLHRLLLDD